MTELGGKRAVGFQATPTGSGHSPCDNRGQEEIIPPGQVIRRSGCLRPYGPVIALEMLGRTAG